MVNNPIYVGDGPVYDCILAQPETSLDKKCSDPTSNQQYEIVHTPNTQSLNTDRYVGQPKQPLLRRNSLDTSASDDSSKVVCTSVSLASAGGVSLKSNGQPRNKLNLTISLETSNEISSAKAEEEGAYTLMNPVGSICQVKKTNAF